MTALPSVDQELGQLPHLFGGTRRLAAEQRTVEKPTDAQRAERQERLAKSRESVNAAVAGVARLQPGTEGRAAAVKTNFFPVTSTLDTAFYQYDVVLRPELRNPRLRKEVVGAMVATHVKSMGVPDGIVKNTILFTPRPIHDAKKGGAKGAAKAVVTLQSKAQEGARGWRGKDWELALTFTRAIEKPKAGLSTEMYGILTSILSEAFDNAGLQKIAGKYFDIDNKFLPAVDIPDMGEYTSLQLMHGFNFVLHPTSRGLLLNADITFRTSRSTTVLDTINAAKEQYKGKEGMLVADEELEATTCITTYLHDRRRQCFRVTKVCWDKNPLSVIPGSNPPCTFKKYMEEHHNLAVKDEKQPLLLFRHERELDRDGKPKEFYFIPEFARQVGQSGRMRQNQDLQQALKKRCLVDSATRFGMIVRTVEAISRNQAVAQYLKKWGVTIDPRLVEAPARVQGKVGILSGKGELRQNPERRSWLVQKGVALSSLAKAPKLWCVAHPDRADVRPFVDSLLGDTINGVGGKWGAPEYYPYQSSRNPQQNARALKRLAEEINEDAEFVLFVLPDNGEEFYLAVKKLVLQDWCVPSQCVTMRNATNARNLLNVSSRVAGQILVKTGSSLWHIQGGEIPNALVCGVDFATAKNGAEVTSLSAVDGARFEYVGGFHGSGKRGATLSSLVGQAVDAYKKTRGGKPPSSIVLYRSGGDEGDVPRMIEEEMLPVHKQCEKLKVNLCFVASLKRSHARFFPAPSGTIVDANILPSTGFSFLMVPQVVNIGTATAMKFSVLANGAPKEITGSKLESLTFKLCHMFYGWWGTTREPSVVMYATREAALAAKLDPKKAFGKPVGHQAF